ncbi:hypothetical protein [Microbispora sp. H10670]|uniref:hypothetical protein n=1 Tax=Microbispora sp. H10670 TaxID=2729108 RepID=UPI0015FF1058|nr:hypothetical protein [Microbispora sp. H10670]
MQAVGAESREVRRLAEPTPPSRERFVDLLRAVSIVAVVLGHWPAPVPHRWRQMAGLRRSIKRTSRQTR